MGVPFTHVLYDRDQSEHISKLFSETNCYIKPMPPA
jgi:hypothetical protein